MEMVCLEESTEELPSPRFTIITIGEFPLLDPRGSLLGEACAAGPETQCHTIGRRGSASIPYVLAREQTHAA